MAYYIEDRITDRAAWRRSHRPEEYIPDVIHYIAREIKMPRALLMPLTPVARGILRRWEDAAQEFTEYIYYEHGRRVMRTVFMIHNYSNSVVYTMMEKALKIIGVGKSSSLQQDDVDFAWVLLGGVLNDYASRAGVTRATIDALLAFRLRNSDYHTVTTWYPDCVEIANLLSGHVETLALPEKDIRRIVDWALEYHRTKCRRHYKRVQPGTDDREEFDALMKRYEQITRAVPGV